MVLANGVDHGRVVDEYLRVLQFKLLLPNRHKLHDCLVHDLEIISLLKPR